MQKGNFRAENARMAAKEARKIQKKRKEDELHKILHKIKQAAESGKGSITLYNSYYTSSDYIYERLEELGYEVSPTSSGMRNESYTQIKWEK